MQRMDRALQRRGLRSDQYKTEAVPVESTRRKKQGRLSPSVAYKPLAATWGTMSGERVMLVADPEHPGYWVDPDGLRRDGQGRMVVEPECWTCGDLAFVKVRPLRPRSAWDWELAFCPEKCWE